MTTHFDAQHHYLRLAMLVFDVGLPTLRNFFDQILVEIGNSREKFNDLISHFHKADNDATTFVPVSVKEWQQERTFGWYLKQMTPFAKGIPSKKAKNSVKSFLFTDTQKLAFEVLETFWRKLFRFNNMGKSKTPSRKMGCLNSHDNMTKKTQTSNITIFNTINTTIIWKQHHSSELH